jgi:tetratricopeptide (TPR) repeat protein
MPGWLVRVALAVLLVVASAPARGDQQADPAALALAEALATYRGGDLRAALARLETIPEPKLHETVFRFCTLVDASRPALRFVRMRIAAALLTEMGLARIRNSPVAWRDPYLASARALMRTLVRMADDGEEGAGDKERRFARDWYLLMAAFRHGRAEVGWSRAYLAEAREFFPKDPQVLLVTGSDHEMVSHVSAGYIRRFSADGQSSSETRINPEKELEEAEKYFKQAAALAPDLAEARLRLGRVLMRRGDLDGATRELRAALEHTAHDQVLYLAWLLLGLVDVDRGNLESAEKSYLEALRLFPRAQAVKVAMSELAYLKGRDGDAAAQVVSMLQSFLREDPWWAYLLGEAWHFEARLAGMRAEALR